MTIIKTKKGGGFLTYKGKPLVRCSLVIMRHSPGSVVEFFY